MPPVKPKGLAEYLGSAAPGWVIALLLSAGGGVFYLHRSAVKTETENVANAARITELKAARDTEIAEMKRRTEKIESRIENLCQCK